MLREFPEYCGQQELAPVLGQQAHPRGLSDMTAADLPAHCRIEFICTQVPPLEVPVYKQTGQEKSFADFLFFSYEVRESQRRTNAQDRASTTTPKDQRVWIEGPG